MIEMVTMSLCQYNELFKRSLQPDEDKIKLMAQIREKDAQIREKDDELAELKEKLKSVLEYVANAGFYDYFCENYTLEEMKSFPEKCFEPQTYEILGKNHALEFIERKYEEKMREQGLR